MASQTLFGDNKSISLSLEFNEATSTCTIFFGEEINESLKFPELSKAVLTSKWPVKKLLLDLHNTTRINSQGAKGWLLFIRDAQASTKIEFSFLSEPLVELASMWPGVLGNPRLPVTLLEVPFTCPSCQAASRKTFKPEEIKIVNDVVKLGTVACDKCGKAMEPDVIPEEYFGWLTS